MQVQIDEGASTCTSRRGRCWRSRPTSVGWKARFPTSERSWWS